MTYIFIIVTVIVSLLAMSNAELFQKLSFSPWLIYQKKQNWRFITHGLIHAGWAHLAINMLVLYSFGRHVEEAYRNLFGSGKGQLLYLLLYVGGILFSTLYDFGRYKTNPYYQSVGASGAVSAVLFTSILIAPTSKLFVFPIPFPIPAYIFGGLYLVYSIYMNKKGQDNIGHIAHFMGALFGLIYTITLKPSLLTHFFNQI
ncbi:rhomboid family intramembrane serine protease [Bacteroidales bacterium]